MSGAGPSQAVNCAPSGGSAAAVAASVGVVIRGAGPSQAARVPRGNRREAPLGGRLVP